MTDAEKAALTGSIVRVIIEWCSGKLDKPTSMANVVRDAIDNFQFYPPTPPAADTVLLRGCVGVDADGVYRVIARSDWHLDDAQRSMQANRATLLCNVTLRVPRTPPALSEVEGECEG